MISTSTQIIGEKPQTVSGPLWGIIHPSVVLTLMMVSRAVREVIYAARHCLLGLQHQGELGGSVGGGRGRLYLLASLFLHVNPTPSILCQRLQFLCSSLVIQMHGRGVGG